MMIIMMMCVGVGDSECIKIIMISNDVWGFWRDSLELEIVISYSFWTHNNVVALANFSRGAVVRHGRSALNCSNRKSCGHIS